MPSTRNNLIWNVLDEIFHMYNPIAFETGEMELFPHDKSIVVETCGDILKVWTSITSEHHIYHEHFERNYISDVMILPNGFQFDVKINHACKVNWFIMKG